AHQGGGDLGAGVAAGADEQGDEERQGHHLVELVLEVAQHGAGVGLGDEQDQKPDDAFAPQQQRRGAQVGRIERVGAALPLGVLGGLVVDDVGDVVGGDDPDQAPLVDDGQREQMVVD